MTTSQKQKKHLKKSNIFSANISQQSGNERELSLLIKVIYEKSIDSILKREKLNVFFLKSKDGPECPPTFYWSF